MTQPRRRLVSTRAIHTPGILAFLRAFRARDLTPEAGDRAVRFYMVSQAHPYLTFSRIVSTPSIHHPGLRAFRARDLTPEAGDRAVCFYMVAQAFPDLTVCEIVKVVEGRYTVEGEDVILADAPEPTGGYGNYGDDGDDDDIPF